MTSNSHPANPAAERSLLGAILLRPSMLAACLHAGLLPEHFSCSSNGEIFRTLVRMADEGKPIDSGLLVEEIDVEKVGGQGYIADLTTDTILVESHILERCRIIMRKSELRNIIAIAYQMEIAAKERGAIPEQIAAQALESLTLLTGVRA